MSLAIGDVIARIGGDGGGGGPAPRRTVYELGGVPIPTEGGIIQAIDASPGDVVAAMLEWDGPGTWSPVVEVRGSIGMAAAGVDVPADWAGGMMPVSVIGTQRSGIPPEIQVRALAEGYTATRLTVIVIPHIEDTH